MKLLVISNAYPPDIKGGGEISTQCLVEAMKDAGHDVDVLTIGGNESVEFINGTRVERILSPNIYWNYKIKAGKYVNMLWHMLENWNPWARHVVRKRLKELKPDLVITSTSENFGCNAWAAARDASIPCVHILRSYNTMCTRAIMFKDGANCDGQCKKCNLLSLNKKSVSNDVQGIVGISNHILDIHKENGFFQNASSAVLTNFVPDSVIDDASQAHSGSRPLHDQVTFGYLGRISEEKGVPVLAEAWKNIAQEFPVKLVLGGLGDPLFVNRVKKKLSGMNADFIGWTGQEDFFSKIDYLVVPSIWHEPLGRIVFEAFCYGIPVLGSKHGGIPDMIKEGENGYLFDPRDQAQLETLLRQCASDKEKYKILSANAFKSRDNYRSSRMAKKYSAYFEKIVSTAGRN